MRDYAAGASDPFQHRRRPNPPPTHPSFGRDSAPQRQPMHDYFGPPNQHEPSVAGLASALQSMHSSPGRAMGAPSGPPLRDSAGPFQGADAPMHGDPLRDSAGPFTGLPAPHGVMGRDSAGPSHIAAALAYAEHRIQQLIQAHLLSQQQADSAHDPRALWRQMSGGDQLHGAARSHGFGDVGAFLDRGGQDIGYRYSPGSGSHPAFAGGGPGPGANAPMGMPDTPDLDRQMLDSFEQGAGQHDSGAGGTFAAILASVLGPMMKPPAPRRHLMRPPGLDGWDFERRQPGEPS